jgi:HSP20 family protein
MANVTDRPTTQRRPLAEDLRALLEELDRTGAPSDPARGEYAPAVDVTETDDALEVLVNVPGVSADLIRVVARPNALIIAGDKRPSRAPVGAVFHLAERDSGRFARVIHLSNAFDARRATARLHQGELRISVPKLSERRGDAVPIPITVG